MSSLRQQVFEVLAWHECSNKNTILSTTDLDFVAYSLLQLLLYSTPRMQECGRWT